jgi:hypothetical protein
MGDAVCKGGALEPFSCDLERHDSPSHDLRASLGKNANTAALFSAFQPSTRMAGGFQAATVM